MAASSVKKILFTALSASVFICARAQNPVVVDSNAPISLDAASSDFDYRNNLLVFKKVRITQGQLSVEADEARATGLKFDNSRWTFKGAVRIHLPNGYLNAETALVSFRNNEIAQAHITGMPATFEQRRAEQNQVAHGKAGVIDYDVTQGTVRLVQDAWISDGSNEITGETLVYNIAQERVLANPGEQEGRGVSITINPRTLRPQSPSEPTGKSAP